MASKAPSNLQRPAAACQARGVASVVLPSHVAAAEPLGR